MLYLFIISIIYYIDHVERDRQRERFRKRTKDNKAIGYLNKFVLY